MSNIITSTTDVNLLRIDLAKLYFDEMGQDTMYQESFRLEDKSYSPLPDQVVTHEIYGLGPMMKRYETTPFAYDAPGPAGSNKAVYEHYALAVKFTETLLDRGRRDIIDKIINELKQAYHLRRNTQAAEFWADAFTGSTYLGPDGKALIVSDHVTYGAGADRSNYVNAAFSQTAVMDIVTLMRKQRNNRGAKKPAIMGNESLLFMLPVELESEADRVFDTGSQLNPATTSDINVVKKFKHEYMLNHWLQSTTNWFVQKKDKSQLGVILVDEQPLTPDTNPDPLNTKGVQHDVRARWAPPLIERWEPHYGGKP